MGPTLHTMLGTSAESENEFSQSLPGLRADLLQSVTELITLELNNLRAPIAAQALEHVHADEVILTYGRSKTVEEFLMAARKKREFKVIVAESAPHFSGHEMAMTLAKGNIDTTVINDSAIFAMMARVNKVVIACHAVMANGGLLVPSGGHMIALAARQYSVPVVCITGLYKLCPLYPHDQDTFNELNTPSPALRFGEHSAFSIEVDVVNPAFDYIPPDLVDLFITNFGGHQPSYIYRLLAEYYSPQDYKL
jgi:translation initiation factor eIF-2B subunit beta